MTALPHFTLRDSVVLLALVALFIVNSFIFYVGPIGSDDHSYVQYALEMLSDDGAYKPMAHWGFRYTLLVPLAGFISLFGVSEASLHWFNIVLNISVFLYLAYLLSKAFNPKVALWSVALLVVAPLFVVQSSIINVDLTEAACSLFVLLHLFLFHKEEKIQHAVLAGVFLGLVVVNRETGAFIALSVVLLFVLLKTYKTPKVILLVVGVSALPLVFEAVYFLMTNGDPIHHFRITLKTHLGGGVDLFVDQSRGLGTGNVLNGSFFEPFFVLFFNQEFGLLFFLLFPAGYYAIKAYPKYATGLVITLVAVFVLVSFLGVIRPLPRYYTNVYMIAIVLTAIWFQSLSSKKIVYVFLFVAATNVGFLLLEQLNPIFHSKQLILLTEEFEEKIYSDASTERRASALNVVNGKNMGMVETVELNKGDLYYYVPNKPIDQNVKAVIEPIEHHELVRAISPPKIYAGKIIDLLGLDGFLPEDFYHKLAVRQPDGYLLKIAGN